MSRRLRHCWLVITGRIDFDFSTERMEFYMALEKTLAAAAELQAAANRVIGQLQASEQSSAQATSDLATADDQAAAAIQPVIDALNAAVPPVPTDTPSA